MKKTDVAAIIAAGLLFVGPNCPIAEFRGSGANVFIDRHWSYFEVSSSAAWELVILAAVIVGLVVLKQTVHVFWAGVAAFFVLRYSTPFEFLRAFADQYPLGTTLNYAHQGAGWGIFVLGAGAGLAILVGLIELKEITDARRRRASNGSEEG